MNAMTTYVSANEAARMLGVTKPTLYAYVSRGIVGRSTAADGRTSLYARDEIQQLAGRARGRRDAAPATIDVQISSTITELQDEGVRYRGHDATELARTHTFEQVAELLWTGRLERCRDSRGRSIASRSPVAGRSHDAAGADGADRCD